MPDVWEEANGFDRHDPSDADLDADRDGLTNAGEWLAGTNPRDSQSVFTLRGSHAASDGFSFRYSTLTGRVYRVQARDLTALAPWSETSVTNGTGSEVEFRQPSAAGDGKLFRVKLEPAP